MLMVDASHATGSLTINHSITLTHPSTLNMTYPKHSAKFNTEFKPPPWLSTAGNALVTTLILKYWAIFDNTSLFLPVKDYECVIDMDFAALISLLNFGPCQLPIMYKTIDALEKLGHMSQIHDRHWLFKALHTPKPHKKHVTSIDDFIWWFASLQSTEYHHLHHCIPHPVLQCCCALTS